MPDRLPIRLMRAECLPCYAVHMTTQMKESTTLSVRLAPSVKARLGQLADATKRTKSFLAAEAIADYVARELAIIEGIGKGLSDMNAGRLVPHKKAMERLQSTVAAASRRKR